MSSPGRSRGASDGAAGGVTPLLPAAAVPTALSRRLAAAPWPVVAGAFLVMFVGFGASYSFAAFAAPLAREFGLSHAATSLVFGLSGFATYAVAAVSGPLADRAGSRAPAMLGMLLVALGLGLAACATTLPQLLVSYGLLVGLGVGLAYVPAIAAVQRGFTRRRGLASGIAAAGIGLGTALVPVTAEMLMAQGGGWRRAFLVYAFGAAMIGLAGAALLGGKPTVLPTPATPGGAAATLRLPGFVTCWIGALLLGLPIGLPFAHLCSFAVAEQGLAWPDAVRLLGLLGLASVLGRFGLGALADEVGRRRVFLGCCAGLVAATLWWALARDGAALRLYAIGFGLAYGGFVALLPAVIVEAFGTARAGSAIGLLYTSRAVALLGGPPLMALAAQEGIPGSPGAALPVTGAALLGLLGTLLVAWATRGSRKPA